MDRGKSRGQSLYQVRSLWSSTARAYHRTLSSYSDSTFTLCTALGASAQFTFNGTGIWIYGAKRPNHNLYNVTLDGGAPQTFNGSADNIFQTPLFSQTDLSNTQHTITLTNAGVDATRTNDYLDVDFVRTISRSFLYIYSSTADYLGSIVWH